MNETNISAYYDKGYHARGADKLKFWLMPFVLFVLFGFPTSIGGYVRTYSNFAAPAFYILCGFFVLCPDAQLRTEKLKRALKKTFKFFALLFVTYLAINVVWLLLTSTYWLPELLRKRTLFDFLVLNMWPAVFPMGGSIWFVQSLLYAYIFFLIADKLKLLRFYVPLFILFYLVTLFTGEFSAFAGFPHFGYDFIPGGAITRAIPYMLLGMIVRKNADKLLSHRRWVYLIGFVAGAALAYLEMYVLNRFNALNYQGHMIGFGVMALSLCCLALSAPKAKKNFISTHGKNYARRIYALCQPAAFLLTVGLGMTILPEYFRYVVEYRSILVYALCLALSFLVGYLEMYKSGKKEKKKEAKFRKYKGSV